jgi:hypothetical protein
MPSPAQSRNQTPSRQVQSFTKCCVYKQLKHSSTLALRHSNAKPPSAILQKMLRIQATQTLKHSSTQTLKHSGTQMPSRQVQSFIKCCVYKQLKHSSTQTLRHSGTQTLPKARIYQSNKPMRPYWQRLVPTPAYSLYQTYHLRYGGSRSSVENQANNHLIRRL